MYRLHENPQRDRPKLLNTREITDDKSLMSNPSFKLVPSTLAVISISSVIGRPAGALCSSMAASERLRGLCFFQLELGRPAGLFRERTIVFHASYQRVMAVGDVSALYILDARHPVPAIYPELLLVIRSMGAEILKAVSERGSAAASIAPRTKSALRRSSPLECLLSRLQQIKTSHARWLTVAAGALSKLKMPSFHS